ncbi:hypothetical protein LJC10_01810 [Selenomonadales bacterium OttesenSCG-928-I06]|nr:hypothetical protein [Selenomonadales bacterium OttesenSCG-928-I06]
MKKISKILTILLVVAFMFGSISVQAAPQVVQLTPGFVDQGTLVKMFNNEHYAYYILYDDLNRLTSWDRFNKNGNWEARIFVESLNDAAKKELKEVIDNDAKQNSELKKQAAVQEGKIWGLGQTLKYNVRAKTVNIIQTSYYGDKGEIVYQKSGIEISLNDNSELAKYYTMLCTDITNVLDQVSNDAHTKKQN